MSTQLTEIMEQAGLSQKEQQTLLLVSTHMQNGKVSPQIPTYDLLKPTGLTPLFEDENLLKDLFKEGILVWKTNKGLIADYECRNPATQRKISGVLYMAPDYVKKHLDILYQFCCEGLKNKGSKVYSREQFNDILVAVAKDYDFTEKKTIKPRI